MFPQRTDAHPKPSTRQHYTPGAVCFVWLWLQAAAFCAMALADLVAEGL